MSESETASRPKPQNPGVSLARRKIYVRERLPAVAAEMKSLTDERKDLLARRKEAEGDERREINRRWNFIVERMEALRSERAALMGERDGMPSRGKEQKTKDGDA